LNYQRNRKDAEQKPLSMTTLINTPLLTSPLFFEKGRGISGNQKMERKK